MGSIEESCHELWGRMCGAPDQGRSIAIYEEVL